MGAFLRGFQEEVVEAGLSTETFTENSLKGEHSLVERYQSLKDMVDDLVNLSSAFLRTNKAWRDHAKLYHELAKLVPLIPYLLYMAFFEQITPNLLVLMRNGYDVLKSEACRLMVTLVYYMHHQGRKRELGENVVEEFGKGNSSVKKKAFIEYCS